MSPQLLAISPEAYRPHSLHATERIWNETNCYVDVWIEVLHALQVEPLAAAAFALSCDFEGDQWTFFKFPPEDLREAFGIEVTELNVWRPVIDHVLEQLDLGRLVTVEVDSWFLPDTHGVSYQIDHTKSTIVPNAVDLDARELDYFHNAGFFGLSGDNFDGVFRTGAHATNAGLPPYVETIKLERLRRDDDATLTETAVHGLKTHRERLPATNPITRMGAKINGDLDWLRAGDLETFHLYAFGTCRQCGASAELASDFLTWLADRSPSAAEPLREAAARWRDIATGAKSLQFMLARVARGRSADLEPLITDMASNWDAAITALGHVPA
ncbi:MAG TPA: DUF1839 family protein [Mycobacteriales bacterium]|nr:DUF1839 family protein [Mycobacteriales bacterium]